MASPRYCPVCGKAVSYVVSRAGARWVHTGTGWFTSPKPSHHDVNTYAPDRLLTTPRSA